MGSIDGKSIICWEIFGRKYRERNPGFGKDWKMSSILFVGQDMLWQSHGGSFGAYHICIVAKYLKLQARFFLQNST